MHRRTFHGAVLAASIFPKFGRAQSEPFPSRAMKIVVPFPAGGPTDTLARTMADQLRASLGQPVIVENKAGAGGNIGLANAMRAPRDGYTLALITATTSAVNPALYASLGYEVDDVAPIAVFAQCGYVLIGRSTGPSTLKELIAKIRGSAASMNGGHSSAVSLVGVEAMKKFSGADFVSVPYKSDTEVLNALMAGDVDFSFTVSPQLPGLIQAGKLKAIATATPQRSPLAPEVPTFEEAGFPGFFDLTAWYGLAVQTGVASDIVNRLNSEIQKALQSPEFAARLKAMGLSATSNTPAQAADWVRKDRLRWAAPIKASGATI